MKYTYIRILFIEVTAGGQDSSVDSEPGEAIPSPLRPWPPSWPARSTHAPLRDAVRRQKSRPPTRRSTGSYRSSSSSGKPPAWDTNSWEFQQLNKHEFLGRRLGTCPHDRPAYFKSALRQFRRCRATHLPALPTTYPAGLCRFLRISPAKNKSVRRARRWMEAFRLSINWELIMGWARTS